ncbi:MAG: phosphate ABC transporter permease subunit PstC [Acholeplasma sp.]|nr:phosphate ABC transporter permease subunit PstC [Acholeplasma sp.]
MIGQNRNQTKRKVVDVWTKYLLFTFTLLSSSFIVIIAGVILQKGLTPFITNNDGLGRVSVYKFFTGFTWLTGDMFNSNLYSVGFIILYTIIIAFLSLIIALPVGVLTALFIARIAPKRLRELFRTVIEMLASIPSIIYGLFGSGVILTLIYQLSFWMGYQSKGGNSMLASVLVLAIMIIPTITSVSEVAIRSVDASLVEASLALGASKSQTQFKVVLGAAKSGIFTSAILGVGRALGEATAVSLVIGNRKSGFTINIFDTASTLTTVMLEGMKETTGIDYDIRFSVGLVLMMIILFTNFTLNKVKRWVGSVDVK